MGVSQVCCIIREEEEGVHSNLGRTKEKSVKMGGHTHTQMDPITALSCDSVYGTLLFCGLDFPGGGGASLRGQHENLVHIC